MIEVKNIEGLLKEKISCTSLFLVEVKVDTKNNVSVIVDAPQGLSIEQCVEISRFIENSLDREAEDFGLEVSSPGIGQPFKVIEQYHKVLNKWVEVLFKTGVKREAILKEVLPEEIVIEYQIKEKAEGEKRPKLVTKTEIVQFSAIKTTKEIIKF